jgi:hypothetical protein
MKISNLLKFLLFFCWTFCELFCPNAANTAQDGDWAKDAIPIDLNSPKKIEIPAPNHKMTAIIDDFALSVMEEGRRLSGIEHEGVLQPAELAWSPDSTAFFITATDGGWVGTWNVRVYIIENGTVRYCDVTKAVIKRFEKHYKCQEPQPPNIGAIRWLKDSKNLLVAAEVPPHSNCHEMGKRMGYIVEIPTGRIIQEVDEKELKGRWGKYLGERLK